MHRHFEHYNKKGIANARVLRKEMTDAEQRLWRHLRNNQLGVKIRRQVPFGPYILDFYCQEALLCIEVDGGQHYDEEGMTRDAVRNNFLKENGVTVVRVSNRDALSNTNGVLQMISEQVNARARVETPPQSSPKRGGGA